jgi:hypothetical protein
MRFLKRLLKERGNRDASQRMQGDIRNSPAISVNGQVEEENSMDAGSKGLDPITNKSKGVYQSLYSSTSNGTGSS